MFLNSKKTWIILALLVAGFLGLLSAKTSFTISQVIGQNDESESMGPKLILPEKDPDRINILLLGIRGLDDPGEGKLLSDAIVVLSLKKEGNSYRTALISFPRDLYNYLWCADGRRKINFAYVYGGMDCAAKTISALSGLYIDHTVSIDFGGLEGLVDALGGITITRDDDFEESVQWAQDGTEENENWYVKKFDEGTENEEERWVFKMPEGESKIDGETTLYYVRSRYSSNDFDRMKRQHEVLFAIKEKALSLGVLLNPVKIYNILDVLGKNLKTTMELGEIKDLILIAQKTDIDNVKTQVFDTTPEGLLYQTFINKEYVLLPVGDSFDSIKKACLNIFN